MLLVQVGRRLSCARQKFPRPLEDTEIVETETGRPLCLPAATGLPLSVLSDWVFFSSPFLSDELFQLSLVEQLLPLCNVIVPIRGKWQNELM